MSHSLRLRLTIAVIAVTAPLMAGFAFLLYQAVADAVWDGFDAQLADDAGVMADLLEFEGAGFDVEEVGFVVARFDADPDGDTQYQVVADGSTLLRSEAATEALETRAATSSEPEVWDGEFGDGRRARFLAFSYQPRVDPEEVAPGTPAPTVAITIGRDTRDIDGLLVDLAAWFWMLGTGMVLVSSGVAGFAVSRGLRPMTRVTQAIADIDEEHLDTALDAQTVPIELRPLVDRLNALLARLDAAFARERQFSADVAHELRTPLAVLHANVDLARKDPSASQAVQRRLDDMLETIEETSRLVGDLLELARSEAGVVDVVEDSVDLRDMVEQEWAAVAEVAKQRGLTLRNEIAPATYLDTDPTKLRRIVANLLSNASVYTEEGGWVEVASRPDEGLWLEVRDSGPPIPDEQLPRLFDRFWRADEARTAVGTHAGVGLALVRTLANLLGCEVVAANEGPVVCFSVRRRGA